MLKKGFIVIFTFLTMMFFSVDCRAEYQYEVIGPAKIMVYKEGIIFNKWHPKRFDGMYFRGTYTDGFFPPRIDPRLSRFIEYYGGSCRIYTRNLKDLEFYRYINKSEKKVRMINVSNRETYVSFPCKRY